jgi:hypothetical protein
LVLESVADEGTSFMPRNGSAAMRMLLSPIFLASMIASRFEQFLRLRVTVVAMTVLLLGLPIFGVVLVGVAPSGNSSSVNDGAKKAHTLANYNPYFAQNLPLNLYADTDVAFNMSIKVGDFNNDTVNVTWEWGDGSANATNTTDPASVPQWVNQTHTWTVPKVPGAGDYSVIFSLNITLDDGMGGTAKTTRNVYVYVPPNGAPTVDLSAPSKVDPNDNVTIVGNASDPEGDPLTWTFVFNNSVTDIYTVVFHTPASAPDEVVWQNVSYTFGTEGIFTVRLNVSDAQPPFDVWPHNVSTTVMILAAFNQPPSVGAINAMPQSLIINSTLGYLVVNCSLEVADSDGDILTGVWDFGGLAPEATNVSAGGAELYTFVQQLNFTDVGSYNISVTVTDGRPGHEITRYKDLDITSLNLPPSMVNFNFNYSNNRSFALPNETIMFTLTFEDNESNPIMVVVNWGDNSSLEYYNLTQFVGQNTSLTLNHTFTERGTFEISIFYTDNRVGLFDHNKYYNATVTVDVPKPSAQTRWTAWDYISLSLFVMLFVLPMLWAVLGAQLRKRAEARGEEIPRGRF